MKSNKDYYDKLERQRYNHEYYIEHRNLKGKTPKQMADYIKKANKGSLGYHYGDLGKARDTNYFSINKNRRSTGHYGRGTYFMGEELDKNTTSYKMFYGNRPLNVVDFNEYKNLYKANDEIDARTLHDILKDVDNQELDYIGEDRATWVLGKTKEEIQNAYSKAIEKSKEYEKLDYQEQLEADTIATSFMKELGYNGIDTRGIEGFDNTTYGSVIYDLNNKGSNAKFQNEDEYMELADECYEVVGRDIAKIIDMHYEGTDESWQINEKLREGTITESDKELINALDTAISKYKITKDVKSVRYQAPKVLNGFYGINVESTDYDRQLGYGGKTPASRFYEQLKDKIGTIVENPGYTSTSTNEEGSTIFKPLKIKMEFDIPKGTNCYITGYRNEQEIILPRNQKMRLEEVKLLKSNRYDDEEYEDYYGSKIYMRFTLI